MAINHYILYNYKKCLTLSVNCPEFLHHTSVDEKKNLHYTWLIFNYGNEMYIMKETLWFSLPKYISTIFISCCTRTVRSIQWGPRGQSSYCMVMWMSYLTENRNLCVHLLSVWRNIANFFAPFRAEYTNMSPKIFSKSQFGLYNRDTHRNCWRDLDLCLRHANLPKRFATLCSNDRKPIKTC